MSNTPLISIIIPTHGRQHFLPRAINSALHGFDPNDIEVIVVPNGDNIRIYNKVFSKYSQSQSVKIFPHKIAHANVARNYGLSRAKGKFVRFLDDDDYLISCNASEQVYFLHDAKADICSGLIQNTDSDLSSLGLLSFPDTNDFVAAALIPSGVSLPIGNVYNRQSLISSGALWQENINVFQDLIWLLTLCSIKEWHWVKFAKPVACWYQHDGQRTSFLNRRLRPPYHVIDALLNTYRILNTKKRINHERLEALSNTLWKFCYDYIPYNIKYWSNIINYIFMINPDFKPPTSNINTILYPFLNYKNIEIIKAYPRLIYLLLQEFKRNLFGWNYKRHA